MTVLVLPFPELAVTEAVPSSVQELSASVGSVVYSIETVMAAVAGSAL